MPASENFVKFDLQFPKGTPDGGNPRNAPFGWVLLDGPTSVVKSAKVKRDGSPSHLRFFSCEDVTDTGRQVVKFVCDDRGPDHQCDDIMEGGLAGSIVEMPDGCGPGKYAVAHAIDRAWDQLVPPQLAYINNETVLELVFDYDFGLVKRDAGDVYFRADYSNTGNYWYEAVTKDPPSKRSLNRRFFSDDTSQWATVFTEWLDKSIGQGTIFETDLSKTLYSNAIDVGSGQHTLTFLPPATSQQAARWQYP